MEMWNKISKADFLKYFGIARLGFDGLRLVKMAEKVDDGDAITMQVLKLLSGGEPVGFNDLRYWDSEKNLYWLVNSGAGQLNGLKGECFDYNRRSKS